MESVYEDRHQLCISYLLRNSNPGKTFSGQPRFAIQARGGDGGGRQALILFLLTQTVTKPQQCSQRYWQTLMPYAHIRSCGSWDSSSCIILFPLCSSFQSFWAVHAWDHQAKAFEQRLKLAPKTSYQHGYGFTSTFVQSTNEWLPTFEYQRLNTTSNHMDPCPTKSYCPKPRLAMYNLKQYALFSWFKTQPRFCA